MPKIIIKTKKYFENIPLDLLYDILSKLYLNDLGNICCINKYFIEKILNNQEFWKRNYLSHFNFPVRTITDWKKIYLEVCERHCKEYIYPPELLKNIGFELWENEEVEDDNRYEFNEDGYDIDKVTEILLEYFEDYDIKLQRGDLLYPEKLFDLESNNGILIYDNEKIDHIKSNYLGELDIDINILEDPEYFPPSYWSKTKEEIKNKINLNFRGVGGPIIEFNYRPYKKELINNLKIDDNFPENNLAFTSFIDIKGIKRNIMIYETENSGSDFKESLEKSFLEDFLDNSAGDFLSTFIGDDDDIYNYIKNRYNFKEGRDFYFVTDFSAS